MVKDDFFITTISGQIDVSDIIATRETLNNNIKLSDFGAGVKTISFFALIEEEPSRFHSPFWTYKPEKKEIEGSLPLDYKKAVTFVDRDAQRLVAHALFELFDKLKSKVKHFDFEALKKAMLNAIEKNPTFSEKSGFRVYSDYNIPTGDLPDMAKTIAPYRYGDHIKKIFLSIGFFKNTKYKHKPKPRYDTNKHGLYISVISGLDMDQFSSELDRNIELIKPQVNDFDFELFKADILNFAEGLRVAA